MKHHSPTEHVATPHLTALKCHLFLQKCDSNKNKIFQVLPQLVAVATLAQQMKYPQVALTFHSTWSGLENFHTKCSHPSFTPWGSLQSQDMRQRGAWCISRQNDNGFTFFWTCSSCQRMDDAAHTCKGLLTNPTSFQVFLHSSVFAPERTNYA